MYVCDEPGYRSIAESQLTAAGIDSTESTGWIAHWKVYGCATTAPCSLSTKMRCFGSVTPYAGRPYDDSFPGQATRWWGEDFYDVPLYMEGGNFFSDGNGTCVSTNIVFEWYASEFSWITEDFANDIYASRLGCEDTIWLEPLIGEGTGHVDMFFTFIDRDNASWVLTVNREDVFGPNAAFWIEMRNG